jgi:hypothetical protein
VLQQLQKGEITAMHITNYKQVHTEAIKLKAGGQKQTSVVAARTRADEPQGSFAEWVSKSSTNPSCCLILAPVLRQYLSPGVLPASQWRTATIIEK